MAELNPAARRATETASSCCAPAQQASCCEPSDKAVCCNPSHGEGCGCAAGQTTETPTTDIREQVRERYAAAALSVTDDPSSGCCTPSDAFDGGSEVFGAALYELGDREQIPDTAALASLGCGNPTAVAELHEGETVLDLGSGGGIDVLLSAKRVGSTGLAYGLDMTDEMLALARENQQKAGVENVQWLRGHIEEIPLPADTVDVVISNCVINLSGDKPQGDRRSRPCPASRRTVRRLRRDRRREHGRRHQGRHAGIHRLHRRRAHPRRVRADPHRRRVPRRRDPGDAPGARVRQLGDRPRPQAASPSA